MEKENEININRKNNQLKPWFCEDIRIFAAEKQRDFLRYPRQEITYEEYKITRNRINSKTDKIEERFFERSSADMELARTDWKHDLDLKNDRRPVQSTFFKTMS